MPFPAAKSAHQFARGVILAASWIMGTACSPGLDSIIREPPYVWDWMHIDRADFENLEVGAALDFSKIKINRQLQMNGNRPLRFEYRFNPAKARRPVTLDLKDVPFLELLRDICKPNKIAIEESPDKIIFRDEK
jgi:hypothetical protein